MRILGIDPGSRIAGYGVIDIQKTKMIYCASGSIQAHANSYFARVREIYEGMRAVVEQYQPDSAVIEQAFVAKNPDSALKLGQVRGLALSILFTNQMAIHEYPPRVVKKAVTGAGNADKQQVQFMVQKILQLSGQPTEDAADALALVICHFYQGAHQ